MINLDMYKEVKFKFPYTNSYFMFDKVRAFQNLDLLHLEFNIKDGNITLYDVYLPSVKVVGSNNSILPYHYGAAYNVNFYHIDKYYLSRLRLSNSDNIDYKYLMSLPEYKLKVSHISINHNEIEYLKGKYRVGYEFLEDGSIVNHILPHTLDKNLVLGSNIEECTKNSKVLNALHSYILDNLQIIKL